MTTDRDPSSLVDEQLSAWLDDELPPAELKMLVNRLAISPEHQARLARYGLIGSSLRGQSVRGGQSELAALGLGDRVQAALEEAEVASSPAARGRGQRLLSYAVAAGVAMVALGVALVQGPLLGPTGAPSSAGPVAGSSAATAVGDAPPVLVRAGTGNQAPLSPQRLTNYLVYHGKYSGMLSARVTESHIVNHSPRAVALNTVDRFQAQ